jgi:hypothetical protein
MSPLTLTSVWGLSCRFQQLSPSKGQVSHVLLTRSPLSLTIAHELTFDLHVLGTPPAFILSQDQTLHLEVLPYSSRLSSQASLSSLDARTACFLSLCCC